MNKFEWGLTGAFLLLVIMMQLGMCDGNTTETNRLIIVDENGYHTKRVSKNDSIVKNIWREGINDFVLNNSSKSIYLESVNYGFPGFESIYQEIESNSIYASESFISYVFSEPPISLKTRHSGGERRFHLHY